MKHYSKCRSVISKRNIFQKEFVYNHMTVDKVPLKNTQNSLNGEMSPSKLTISNWSENKILLNIVLFII